MIAAGVVENHVHHYLYVALVGVGYKFAPLLVAAEARVDVIVVGGGISVICSAGHVVGKHWVNPYCGHSERVDVAEMAAHALDIASVAAVGIFTVVNGRILECVALGGIVDGVAFGKAVGHDEI